VKISVLGRIRQADNGVWQKPDSEYAGMVDLDVSYNPDCLEPVELGRPLISKYDEWMYRGMLVGVQGSDEFSREEIILKIKHTVLRHEKGFERIRREIKAFENFDHADIAREVNKSNDTIKKVGFRFSYTVPGRQGILESRLTLS